MSRSRPFQPITGVVLMVAAVVVAAVIVASVIGVLIAMVSWAMSARLVVEANFSLFSVSVLVGGRDHLTNPFLWLAVEFGAEVAMMESSDEGGDDFSFRDVGNRIPHLGKASDVATKELRWFLIDVVQIVLGAGRVHVAI